MTDIADLWAAHEGKLTGRDTAPQHPEYRYYKPLEEAADEFVAYAETPEKRVYTGIAPIDAQMRGIGPGEVCNVNGYSHSGKTLVLMEMLRANRHRRVMYFCPDEPRTLTLVKLACLTNGMNALTLEQLIASGDTAAGKLLRDTASKDYGNLAVFDQAVTLTDMDRAYEEVTDAMGEEPELVVFDYLELLTGGGDDVPSKANGLKAWGRRRNVPMLVLHQTSRTAGAEGREITISSGAFGGEQQATHIIGVRRRIFEIRARIREIKERLQSPTGKDPERFQQALQSLEYDEQIHRHTVTVNLVKNKRVGGELIEDGIDFEIEQGTGRLRPLYGELPQQYLLTEGTS